MSVYTLVFATGLYFNECKQWQQKAANDKTRANFKTHFLKVQCNLHLQQQCTSGHPGMQANKATTMDEMDTTMPLVNCAEATAANPQAFATHIATNTDLSKQLTTAFSKIQELKNLVLQNNSHTKPKKNN